MTRRLRISHLIVQPVVVWDDGEELTPGPELQTVNLPLSAAPSFIASLPDDIAAIAAQVAEAAAEAAT